MPKFDKSTGYKMKGSTFYGKSISSKSPLKVSDRDIIAAQAQLDKVETKFRQPGWAKAAYKVAQKAKNPMSKDTDLQAKSDAEADGQGGGGGSEEKTQSVSEKMANTGDLSAQQTQQTNFPQSSDDYKIKTEGLGPMMTGSSAAQYRERVDNKRKSPLNLLPTGGPGVSKQFAREQKGQRDQVESQALQTARIDEAAGRSAVAREKVYKSMYGDK